MGMSCYVCNGQSTQMMYIGKRPLPITLYYCENCFHMQIDKAVEIEDYFGVDMISYVDNPRTIMREIKARLQSEDRVQVRCINTGILLNKQYRCLGGGQLSYFSTNSMKVLCESEELCLNKVTCDDEYNKIFEITSRCTEDCNVIDSLVTDMENDLYSNQTYTRFAIEYEIYRNTIHNYILYNIYLTGCVLSSEEQELMDYYGIEER